MHVQVALTLFESVVLRDDVHLGEEEHIIRGTGIQAGEDGPSAGNMEMAENDNPTPRVRLHWTMVDFTNSPAGTARCRVDAALT